MAQLALLKAQNRATNKVRNVTPLWLFLSLDPSGETHLLNNMAPNSLLIFVNWFQGSDPRIATCRGKLQSKRSKLNQEINKELRLRAGAENLFKCVFKIRFSETVDFC